MPKKTAVTRRLEALTRELKALVRAAYKAGHAAGQLSMTAAKCEKQAKQRLAAANAWYDRNKHELAERRYKVKRPKHMHLRIADDVGGHITSNPEAPIAGDDNRTAEEVIADYEREATLKIIESLKP